MPQAPHILSECYSPGTLLEAQHLQRGAYFFAQGSSTATKASSCTPQVLTMQTATQLTFESINRSLRMLNIHEITVTNAQLPTKNLRCTAAKAGLAGHVAYTSLRHRCSVRFRCFTGSLQTFCGAYGSSR
jgi:hypothetical protein